MKFLSVLILLFAFQTHANVEVGDCAPDASKSVKALVEALTGLTVTVVKTELVHVKIPRDSNNNEASTETYKVKLKGNGFSSSETTGLWTIQLYSHGDGCSFKSLKLSK